MAHAINPSHGLLRRTHGAVTPGSQYRDIPRSIPSGYSIPSKPSISGDQKLSYSSTSAYSNDDRGDYYRPGPRRNEDIRSIRDDTNRRRSRSPVRSNHSSVSRSPIRTTDIKKTRHEYRSSSSHTDDDARGRGSRSPTINDTRHNSSNCDDNRHPKATFTRARVADSDSDYNSAYPHKYASSTARRLTKYKDDDTSDSRSSIRGSRRPYISMRDSNTFHYHEFAKDEFKPGVIILAPLHEEDFRRTPQPSCREPSDAMSYNSGQRSHVSHTDFGAVYSETRIHIVVEAHGSIYETIPLYTYKNKGLLYKNRNEYASIVDHRYPELSKREAPRVLVTGKLQHGVEALKPCSVAHLVHPVTRQYNCQVRYMGRIRDADIPLLVNLYRNRHKLSEESA